MNLQNEITENRKSILLIHIEMLINDLLAIVKVYKDQLQFYFGHPSMFIDELDGIY